MRVIRNISKFILLVLTVTMLGSLLLACTATSSDDAYMIYYSNADVNDLLHDEYEIRNSETKDIYAKLSELFYQMFTHDLTEDGFYSAKPESVTMNDYVVMDENVLSVDFSKEYLELTNVQEIILRSAVVLTTIQVDGISGVEFTVEGESIKDTDGNEIGVMSADKFVNVLLNEQGMLRSEADVTLYFANEDKTALVPVVYTFEIDNKNSSMEEYILRMLIAGPEVDSGVYATMASDVELISVSTTDRTCYVNFGTSFLEQAQPVSDEILIYSIVNSICRLSYVNDVVFQIDGQPATVLHQVTDLSVRFTRNYGLEEISANSY